MRARRTVPRLLKALASVLLAGAAVAITPAAGGSVWKRMPSASPGGSPRDDLLNGVTSISSSNAWAVGYYDNGTALRTLATRCC